MNAARPHSLSGLYIILDPSVARLTIGGTFPENDVSALIDTAKQVFGLNVQRRGDQIVISR